MTAQATRRSLAEITAMGIKAARGAGCPWGLAEDAGRAARMAEAHDLPGVAALARLFTAPRACSCTRATDAPECGIAALASLSDRLDQLCSTGTEDLGTVEGAVLLVLPLAQDAADTGRTYRLDHPGGSITIGRHGVVTEGKLPCDPAPLTLALASPPPTPRPAQLSGRDVGVSDWATLEACAARTLVPETEASRARGAGAGTDEQT